MMPLILEDIKLLEFERIVDARGNLSFFENFNQIPFLIKRVEYFYDIPGGERFDGYAYKSTQQVIVALSGSFDVIVHNGIERKCITLNRSYHGLYLPGLVWRQIKNFSTNAVPLVVSNAHFNAADQITNFKSFISLKNE